MTDKPEQHSDTPTTASKATDAAEPQRVPLLAESPSEAPAQTPGESSGERTAESMADSMVESGVESTALAAAGVVGEQQRALAALTGISGLTQGILDGLQDQVDELLAWKDQVEQAGNQLAVPALTRMRWEDLTPDETLIAWRRLIDWVDWAVTEFDLHELPACWYRPEHRRMRRELSALMLAYEEMFSSPRASKGAELTWMAWLSAATLRWAAYDRAGCAHSGHDRASRGATSTRWPDGWRQNALVQADSDATARDATARGEAATAGGEVA
jgi:hypothetical protein